MDSLIQLKDCTPDANESGVYLTAESRRNNLRISAKKEGAIQFKVLKTINHPDYQDNDTPIHDISVWIVKPTNARRDKKNIPIIPLSNSTRINHGSKLAISGWGLTSDDFDGEMSDVLMHAQVPWVSMKKCQSVLGDKVSDNQICAGYDQGGVDSCNGDSGGPLMWWDPYSQKHILVGVTSWGEGCAQPFAYGVYTKVSKYFDWILKVVNENRPQKKRVTVPPVESPVQSRHKRQKIY